MSSLRSSGGLCCTSFLTFFTPNFPFLSLVDPHKVRSHFTSMLWIYTLSTILFYWSLCDRWISMLVWSPTAYDRFKIQGSAFMNIDCTDLKGWPMEKLHCVWKRKSYFFCHMPSMCFAQYYTTRQNCSIALSKCLQFVIALVWFIYWNTLKLLNERLVWI